jgi:hypothetical protein
MNTAAVSAGVDLLSPPWAGRQLGGAGGVLSVIEGRVPRPFH